LTVMARARGDPRCQNTTTPRFLATKHDNIQFSAIAKFHDGK
jgi:hypothetical protein